MACMHKRFSLVVCFSLTVCTGTTAEYDILIRDGMIYDGSGQPPVKGNVAIHGNAIAAVGELKDAKGKKEVDAKGLAVAPGFINMLRWPTQSLIQDGRS